MDHARVFRVQVVAIAAFVAVLVMSGLVVRSSRAAFTAQTVNDNNSFQVGQMTLSQDAPASARFAATGMIPGDSYTECFEVTYTGTADSNSGVRMFAQNLADTDGGADSGTAAQASDDLDIQIETYAAGQTCTSPTPTTVTLFDLGTPAASDGTMVGLASDHTGYAGGLVPGWTPTVSPELRAFEVTVVLGADTADDAQGDSAVIDLVWEIQAGV